MCINEIPDDCLLAIFDYMNNLEDLLNCYKVCLKWSNLITERTKKVKYLIVPNFGEVYSPDFVYYREISTIDATCLDKLFTNLIIVELSSRLHLKAKDAFEFVRKQEPLKGLINNLVVPIEKYCDKLEMVSGYHFKPTNPRNGSSIKQLDVRDYSLKALTRDAHYLPNLERLKIRINVPDYPYNGPVLTKLKILEFHFNFYPRKIFYGFQLMDSCPNLKSAHIYIDSTNWFFDETLKHKCLQDLVIELIEINKDAGVNVELNNLERLLIKYPNLKHFALRFQKHIKDEHIEQLVHILPNLLLLDVRECQEVTQSAADYVKDYCKRYGRSIKFYFNENRYEIESDWPQSSSIYEAIQVNRGFDFMKNCFFKHHVFLSRFLIPNDY